MSGYQIMPDLSVDEFQALKQDIAERGVLVAVEYDEDGQILDGHHRVRACRELGITTWPKIIRQAFTEEEKRSHARKLNLARRHLHQAKRRALIEAQLKETPEQSDRQIAKALGVSNSTVSVARETLETTGTVCDSHTVPV